MLAAFVARNDPPDRFAGFARRGSPRGRPERSRAAARFLAMLETIFGGLKDITLG